MNKYSTISAEQNEYYQRTLLKELRDSVVLMPFLKKAPVPKNEGETTSWRKFIMPALTKTPLTEGVDPSDVDYTVDKITASADQYGTYTKISDRLADHGIDNNIEEAVTMFGEHAALTMDSVAMDVASAGTNVFYGGTAVSRVTVGAGDKFTYSMLNSITEFLKRQNAKKIKMPNGRMGFVALTPPEIMTTIKNLTEWKDAQKYVTPEMIKTGVVGELDGVFFLDANTVPIYTGAGAAGIDVYSMVILGRDCVGAVDVAGDAKPDIIIHNRDIAGSNLELWSTVGWKSLFVAKILEEKALVRVEVAIA